MLTQDHARNTSTLAIAIWAAVAWSCLAQDALAERLRVFEHEQFRGENRIYSIAVPNLRADETALPIASVRVVTGRWLMCAAPNYAGNCVWVARDVPSLPLIGFSEGVASLKPARVPLLRRHWGDRAPASRRALVLFSKPGYDGDWVSLFDSVPDFDADKIGVSAGSVVVNTGTWRLCTGAHFKGRCITLTGSAWDIGDIFGSRFRSAERLE